MLLNREGRFIANIVASGVKIEDGKCPQFAAEFVVKLEWVDDVWQETHPEEISEWFTLRNKNGALNKINCESIIKSLNWDGRSFTALNQADFSQVEVQIVTRFEPDQNGKSRLRVKYLNPRDYEGGGVSKADPNALRALDAECGSLLRATFGGTGAKATATRPTASPSPGNGQTHPATPTAAKSPLDTAKANAWAAFKAANEAMPEAEIPDVWRAAIKAFLPGKLSKDWSEREWNEFTRCRFERPVVTSPISDEPEFTEDDVPF
jgi:hypothetical protein